MRALPRIGIRLHGGLSARACVELAEAADAQNFSAAWFAENAFSRGILPAAAACAVATRHIKIAAGVFNPFSRHPTMMAMEIAALDEFSGGRATLSIGAGIGSAVQKIGASAEKPLCALRDTIAIVRGMLSGAEVTYEGKAFSARNVTLDVPARPDLPLYIAGRGDMTMTFAGEAADGLIVSNMCSAAFAGAAARQVQAGRYAAGRTGDAKIIQYVPCFVAADGRAARADAKRALGEMVVSFWSLSQRVASAKAGLMMGTSIAEDEFAAAAMRIRVGDDAASVLDNRFTDAFSIAGTPDDCLAGASAFAAAGVHELALTFEGPTALGQIALLGHALAASKGIV